MADDSNVAVHDKKNVGVKFIKDHVMASAESDVEAIL